MAVNPISDLATVFSTKPLLVVLAGPNGAGKSTYVASILGDSGLRFINADVLALELGLDARLAATAADELRAELIRQRESFITETVFSDPVGAKLERFTAAIKAGYTVTLMFIGISGPDISSERVALRVTQGGHDVPPDRLITRYPRTLANLRAAIPVLSHVFVYDNDDFSQPYRLIARYSAGKPVWQATDPPAWWRDARPAL